MTYWSSVTRLLVIALLLLCLVLFSAAGFRKYFNISLNCPVITECLPMSVETLFHILRVSLMVQLNLSTPVLYYYFLVCLLLT